jgi:hypothetical protein
VVLRVEVEEDVGVLKLVLMRIPMSCTMPGLWLLPHEVHRNCIFKISKLNMLCQIMRCTETVFLKLAN